MKKAALYMRVSSDKQAHEGDSIAAQRDALRKYARSHGMVIAGEYLDDGISGTKADRDELQRMLSDVQAGKVDVILVTKLDRLYRSIRHYLNMMDVLDRCGVGWVAIWEHYETTTPQGRLMINQMMSFAQYEAELTGQRIRQVQAYKVTQGEVISGSTPPGLTIKGKRLVPDDNADHVRQMFQYYAMTGNLAQTMRRFDHLGIFPRSNAAYKSILRNTKYIGVFRDNDQFCEPVIDRGLFEDVQRKLDMNVKSSQKRTYIFSGLVRCAVCGTKMASGSYYHKDGAHVKTYRCSKRYNRGISQCTNGHVFREISLETYLLENIRPIIENLVLDYEIGEQARPDGRVDALEKRLGRLKELYVNGLIELDEYKADREKILIDIERARTPQIAPDVNALKDLLSKPFETIYSTFSDEEKRFFWRSIVKEIRCDEDKRYKIMFL